MDLIALSGLTVISGHILVASAFGAAIPIVHNDCKDRHGLQSQRRAAVAIVRLVRRLQRRKTALYYETPYTGGAPGSPEASNVQGIDDGGPYADVEGAD